MGAGGVVYGGFSLTGGKDINGDGWPDIAIGSQGGVLGLSRNGAVYVLFGGPGKLTENIDLNLLTPQQGVMLAGGASYDYFGKSVQFSDDVNGDGLADLLVTSTPSTQKGILYVIYGAFGFSGMSSMNQLTSTRGFTIYTPNITTLSVSPAGDLNGDGSTDIVVGASNVESNHGRAYVVYGGINYPTSQPSSQPTVQPITQPTAQPTMQPSTQPTSQPSRQPTSQPTTQPTGQPSGQPMMQPTMQPSKQPTSQPTSQPSRQPTSQPTTQPTGQPSRQPTTQPSGQPTMQPSKQPTSQPSRQPSSQPTTQPTGQPSGQPTTPPTMQPTMQPSTHPSTQPSSQPISLPSGQLSGRPTSQPSMTPGSVPSSQPQSRPSAEPSVQPSSGPSTLPTVQPSGCPTSQPYSNPSSQPSVQPRSSPSGQPSAIPTVHPTDQPSSLPSASPSECPTSNPSIQPSVSPTAQPSVGPSMQPTVEPSICPSVQPTGFPTFQPSCQPSAQPTIVPSGLPSGTPTSQPSGAPSALPSGQPSALPSTQPSASPSNRPTTKPSSQPTAQPSEQPQSGPSTQPSSQPSVSPSGQPSFWPTLQPKNQPSSSPSTKPSAQPSDGPSAQPSCMPSITPTMQPYSNPSTLPSSQPSCTPTHQPNSVPTTCPSGQPTLQPVNTPSAQPSSQPSVQPSRQPTTRPSIFRTVGSFPIGMNNASNSISVVGVAAARFAVILPFLYATSVKGDGFADVTALPIENLNTTYVVFGNTTIPVMIDLSNQQQSSSVVVAVAGLMSYDFSGRSVCSVDDVNSDGYDDLIIGVPYAARVYVLFGTEEGFVNMTEGFTVFGAKSFDFTGWSVSGAGDVNNDTIADIIIGAPLVNNAAGAIYVIYGKLRGVKNIYLTNGLQASDGSTVYGKAKGDNLGLSVSNAGDVNGDGYDDVVVGALKSASFYAGDVYVVFGSSIQSRNTSSAIINNDILTAAQITLSGVKYSWFGYSVSGAGDVNGDGFSDVTIGSVPSVQKSLQSAQTTHLVFGFHCCNNTSTSAHSSNECKVVMPSAQLNTFYGGGIVVLDSGDVDGDGFDDMIVGSQYNTALGGGFLVRKPSQNLTRRQMAPTVAPTVMATTKVPSYHPTVSPTNPPQPTVSPTAQPTGPTQSPSVAPSHPSSLPTAVPTAPTLVPSVVVTNELRSTGPTALPSELSSITPTVIEHQSTLLQPTAAITVSPSRVPLVRPTQSPNNQQRTIAVFLNNTHYTYHRNRSDIHFHVHVNVSTNASVSGTSGHVTYVIVPNPYSALFIQYFNAATDCINLTLFPSVRELSDLTPKQTEPSLHTDSMSNFLSHFSGVVVFESIRNSNISRRRLRYRQTNSIRHVSIELHLPNKQKIFIHECIGQLHTNNGSVLFSAFNYLKNNTTKSKTKILPVYFAIAVFGVILMFLLYHLSYACYNSRLLIQVHATTKGTEEWETAERDNRTFIKYIQNDDDDDNVESFSSENSYSADESNSDCENDSAHRRRTNSSGDCIADYHNTNGEHSGFSSNSSSSVGSVVVSSESKSSAGDGDNTYGAIFIGNKDSKSESASDSNVTHGTLSRQLSEFSISSAETN